MNYRLTYYRGRGFDSSHEIESSVIHYDTDMQVPTTLGEALISSSARQHKDRI